MAIATANGVKACSKCKKKKPADTKHFYANKQTPDGLAYQCKLCASAYSNTAGKKVLGSAPVASPEGQRGAGRTLTVLQAKPQGMSLDEANSALRFLVDELKVARAASGEALRPEVEKRDRAIDSMAREITALKKDRDARADAANVLQLEVAGLTRRVEEQDELILSADEEIKKAQAANVELQDRLEEVEAELQQLRKPADVEFIEEDLAKEIYGLGFKGSR